MKQDQRNVAVAVIAGTMAVTAAQAADAQALLPGNSGQGGNVQTGGACTKDCTPPVIIGPNPTTPGQQQQQGQIATGVGIGVGGEGGSAQATANGGSASSTSGVNGNIGGASTGNATNINMSTVIRRTNPGTSSSFNVPCQGGGEISTFVASAKVATRWQGCEATVLGGTLMQNSRFVENCNQSYQMYYDGRIAAAAGNTKLAKVFTENMMSKQEWCANNVEVGYSTYTPPAPPPAPAPVTETPGYVLPAPGKPRM